MEVLAFERLVDLLRILSLIACEYSRSPRISWKACYFIDIEFTDWKDRQLISIAIVSEDGKEFYGECSDFHLPACNAFVQATVLPQLGSFPDRSMPTSLLALELRDWLLAIPTKPSATTTVEITNYLPSCLVVRCSADGNMKMCF